MRRCLSFNGGVSGLVLGPVFKTGAAPHRGVRWVRFPHALAILFWLAAGPLAAQQTTPPAHTPQVVSRPDVIDTVADSLKKPPIAPRRAMLLSLLLPGYSQARLKHPTSSIVFATAEVLFVGMARKSALDLREAKAARRDSVATSFTVDPKTGAVTPSAYVRSPLVARLGARHTHYEDWIAAIIFNHIISGADAYVAANLWDFNANVALDPVTHSASFGGSLAF